MIDRISVLGQTLPSLPITVPAITLEPQHARHCLDIQQDCIINVDDALPTGFIAVVYVRDGSAYVRGGAVSLAHDTVRDLSVGSYTLIQRTAAGWFVRSSQSVNRVEMLYGTEGFTTASSMDLAYPAAVPYLHENPPAVELAPAGYEYVMNNGTVVTNRWSPVLEKVA